MEPFVRLVGGGGVGMVAGLWVATLAAPVVAPHLAGVVLAVAGVAALCVVIRRELTV